MSAPNPPVATDDLISGLSTGDLVPDPVAGGPVPAPPVSEPRYEVRAKPRLDADDEGEVLEVSIGPHHPSTHGVFRMDVVLDGERVVRLKPVWAICTGTTKRSARARVTWARSLTRTGSTISVRSRTTGRTC